MNDILGDMGFVLLCVILVVIFAPLFLGVLISVLCGLTGLMYFTGVIGVAVILWVVFAIIWWC